MSTRRDLTESPYLAAVTGRKPHRIPVWFMRQAGRSLPEYRALRERHGMLEACFEPELACEITLQPVRRYGVDAAILFSDIVVPLRAAGVAVRIEPGVGPVFDESITDEGGVIKLPALEPDAVDFIDRAVRSLTAELGGTPLIGFAGGPFTLACYLIEGGPSKTFDRTRSLMYGNPELWNSLLDRLADVTTTFLTVQLAAGVSAVQLFDSWAGVLSADDYRRSV